MRCAPIAPAPSPCPSLVETRGRPTSYLSRPTSGLILHAGHRADYRPTASELEETLQRFVVGLVDKKLLVASALTNCARRKVKPAYECLLTLYLRLLPTLTTTSGPKPYLHSHSQNFLAQGCKGLV